MRSLRPMVALALVACGSTPDDGDARSNDPIVSEPDAAPEAPPPDAGMPQTKTCDNPQAILGSGYREFEAVVDGDTVWLFRGPQGGYMIYLSVRAKGLDPSSVMVDYQESFTSTGTFLGAGQWNVALPNDLGDGWHERVGIWGQIDPSFWTTANSSVRGKDVTVKVNLTDKNGCKVEGLGWNVHVNPEKPL